MRYIGFFSFDRREDLLGRAGVVTGGTEVQNGHSVLQVLELLLQVVPAVDGDEHGHGLSTLGYHQRVVAEVINLASDSVS